MKTLKLAAEDLGRLGDVLRQFGEVHAPVARNGGYVFRPVESWSEVCLHYTRTRIPPKKYFLPPRETLFRYDPVKGYIPDRDDLEKRVVLFGVHACDIYGINLLEQVFSGRFPDPYFQARRRNTAIIGIDCTPDADCFCRSMRADFVDHGFDLFLYGIGDCYVTLVGTALGDDMVLAAASIFEPVTAEDIDEYKRRSTEKRDSYRFQVEIRDLPEIFEMEYGSELWNELGERCLGCGACSMVCPTCYCYDVVDTVTLGSMHGSRARTWDSCLFASHAAVASGENFRHRQADRIRFRFYHKHGRFVAEYGRPSCVGCGRCIEACPVGIHVVDVINRLRGVEYASA